jgi:2-oxoglutarate dehydrogenase E2 component (dihydrolipoamide succinyltransferase)
MSTDITVPQLPESVSDATIARWTKSQGDAVKRDDVLVELETDKVVLEVPAPADGVLDEVLYDEGASVTADTVLGRVGEGASATGASADDAQAAADGDEAGEHGDDSGETPKMGPAARKLVAEHGLDPRRITGSGQQGRLTKQDVLAHIEGGGQTPEPSPAADRGEQAPQASQPQAKADSAKAAPSATDSAEQIAAKAGVSYTPSERPEQRVPMTRLRARIAERMMQAKQETAMLTTFNEINMQPIMDLRARYKERFEKAHGIKLGLMGFFVTAAAEALKRFPDINASIDGNEIVYHGYTDIGIAVASDRGLVVPILRNAETLSLAEIESNIRDFGERAQQGKIGIEEMTGGTFTITNGGVFGSLVSTPILNPPQSAILGMHKTQERPVAENGQVVIRPMMYLALSYDHRIVDGKDAVQFLVTIKDLLEDPARLLLDI